MAVLKSIAEDHLPARLAAFRSHMGSGKARHLFDAIAATQRHCPGLQADLFAGRVKALALATQLGVPTQPGDPAESFSWDGAALATGTETTVIFHDIAHWCVCPVERRSLYDFGLGGGPESGRKSEADLVRVADQATAEREELLASVLGMVFEVQAEEPALLAFVDHNWLDDAERPAGARLFAEIVTELADRDLLP